MSPGLYAIGCPTCNSLVFASANYKMSFDRLRSQLVDLDAWILVLDTRGINVWCAAGKGTFGTDEIVRRVEAVRLAEVVSHRRLIVPQLGAPGVSAQEVAQRCGFDVVYGPVRAADIPAFLDAGMTATREMRRVLFPIGDRVALIPNDLVGGARRALLIAACLLLLAGFGPGVYSLDRVMTVGLCGATVFLATAVASIVLVPVFLPWLPGRSFASKGAWVGLGLVAILVCLAWPRSELFGNLWSLAGWSLMILALASFVAMNFTGSSTYTSLSGVRKEMRIAMPIQAVCAATGLVLWMIGRFL